MSRLTRAAPAAGLMLERAAQRGQNIGSLVAKLLDLLDIYGAAALEETATEANTNERVGASPVRLALQVRLRAQGEPKDVARFIVEQGRSGLILSVQFYTNRPGTLARPHARHSGLGVASVCVEFYRGSGPNRDTVAPLLGSRPRLMLELDGLIAWLRLLFRTIQS